MADNSVGAAEIIDGSVGAAEIADGTVGLAELATALKPSQGAGASAEALRALGLAAGLAAPGTHASQHASGGGDPLVVTQAMLDATFAALLPQTGDVKWVAYNVTVGSEPSGWLLCDGRAISRTTYAALFAKIGVTHGSGDGSSTFNLPDCRGRSFVGIGQGVGLTSRTIGAKGGEESHVLATSEMPSHAHGGATATDSPDHSHSGSTDTQGSHQHGYSQDRRANATTGGNYTLNMIGPAGVYSTGVTENAAGAHAHNVSTGGASARHTHGISAEGGGGAHNVMQPWIGMTPLIKT
jgi:microcystin-dependent protein